MSWGCVLGLVYAFGAFLFGFYAACMVCKNKDVNVKRESTGEVFVRSQETKSNEGFR